MPVSLGRLKILYWFFACNKTFTEATVSWCNLFGCGQACSRMYIVLGKKKLAMSPEAVMEAIV